MIVCDICMLGWQSWDVLGNVLWCGSDYTSTSVHSFVTLHICVDLCMGPVHFKHLGDSKRTASQFEQLHLPLTYMTFSHS